MENLTFGIEIETIGKTRRTIAEAITSVTGGDSYPIGGTYDAWVATDAQNRKWKIVTDSSLNATRDFQAEIVSPILQVGDIELLQTIVRAIRKAGAKVDASCGIHIHIGDAAFAPGKIGNLCKIMNKQEDLIYKALAVSEGRTNHWARKMNPDFIRKIDSKKATKNMNELNKAWYGEYRATVFHYDRSRYAGLNLHNIWFRGTIEFRLFNGTLHAGKIKAYVQFCLALSAKAIKSKSAQSKKREFKPETAKYDFRVFLLSLGMIGDEFKTARLHLLSNFEGQSAWRRPAEIAA